MKKLNSITLILLGFLMLSCSSKKNNTHNFDSLEDYNLKGDVQSVEYTSYSFDMYSGEKFVNSNYVYEFNTNGLITKQSFFDSNGGAMQYILFSYDSNNNLIKQEGYQNNEKIYFSEYEYSDGLQTYTNFFDGDGSLQHSLSYKSDGESIIESTDPSGSITKYVWNGDKLAKLEYWNDQNNLMFTQEYNNDALLLKITNNYAVIDYTYNEHNDISVYRSTAQQPEVEDEYYNFEYEYDSHNNFIKQTEYKKGVDAPVSIVERVITYR